MDKLMELYELLGAMPSRIQSVENRLSGSIDRLKLQETTLAIKENRILVDDLSGPEETRKITGKNERQRQAQLELLTQAERTNLTLAERTVRNWRITRDFEVNTFRALQIQANLLTEIEKTVFVSVDKAPDPKD